MSAAGDAVFGRQASPPTELLALQTMLTHAFKQRTPVADDAEQSATCAIHVAGNSRLTPAEQVDIYRRQFWLRHEEVLEEDYPGLAGVLGEDVWGALTVAFLCAHPPTEPNLRDLGAKLPAFLETWSGVPAELTTLARDLARYELAFVDVFDALEPPALDAALLASLAPEAWERARLVLSPLVRRLRFSYPVHRVRLAARAVKEGGGELPMPEPAACHIALFRKNLVVHFEELSSDSYVLLDALGSGETLLAACARMAEGKSESEAAALIPQIAEWFRFWAKNGFIAEVVVDAAAPAA